MREGAWGLPLEEGRCGLLREWGAAGTGKERCKEYDGDPLQRGTRGPGGKGTVTVRTRVTGGMGGEAGGERNGLDGGAGRVLWEQGSWGGRTPR